MSAAERPSVPALPVRQWLDEWEQVRFDEAAHRRRPSGHFYIAALRATHLRALCDIHRRSADVSGPRRNDLGIQRRHNASRSSEIAEFVRHGFPWSALSEANKRSGDYDDLKKPGWLPTAIVVNVLLPGDQREGETLAPEDVVQIEYHDSSARLVLPDDFGPEWTPARAAPIEVIDGQHRLWAFDETADGDYELPVVLFHGLDISWQAYLFYVINIKPAKINTSLGFDLYPLLRTEDWLEHAGGPAIYRESRAQELTEALWSYTESPWYHRIDMLGNSGRRMVTQAAWIRSLLATFIKSWDSRRAPIGGLFGTPTRARDAVLPWTRAQQAAFLVAAWTYLRNSIFNSDEEWATSLRERDGEDAPFSGRHTLPNTDQGVRAILAIFNDLCFVRVDELNLMLWPAGDFPEGTSDIGIGESLATLANEPLDDFLRRVGNALASYDWRTYSAPGLGESAKSSKARFRGSTGYRELRQDVLRHLAGSSDEVVSSAALDVLEQLGWSEP